MSNINEEVRLRVLDAIEDIKISNKYSYREVMESLNDIQQVFTQLKSGKRNPTFEHIVLLNKTHKYSLEWLLKGLPPKRTIKSKTPLERITEIESDIKDLKKHLSKK